MAPRPPIARTRLVAAVAVAFFVLGAVGRLALGARLTAWDEWALERVAANPDPVIAGWMGALSGVGGGWVAVVLALLIGTALAVRGDRSAARCYFVTVLSGWGLNLALKQLFRRPRPNLLSHLDAAGGYSYPSGHSMLAPLVFAFGLYLLTRTSGPVTRTIANSFGAALSIAIGMSRMYLAVHYPSDVGAALVGGTAWAALGLAVYSPLEPISGAARPAGMPAAT